MGNLPMMGLGGFVGTVVHGGIGFEGSGSLRCLLVGSLLAPSDVVLDFGGDVEELFAMIRSFIAQRISILKIRSLTPAASNGSPSPWRAYVAAVASIEGP